MPETPVTLITAAHNEVEYTRSCIDHLRRYTPGKWELIVVDNGSTDGTAEILEGLPSVTVIRNGENAGNDEPGARTAGGAGSVTVIRNDENVGLVKALNQGLAAARGEFVVFLHNDVLVSKGWLDRLLRPLREERSAALAGPRSNEATGIQKAPAPLNTLKALQRFAFDFAREHDGRVFEVGQLSSFCIAARRSAMLAVGPFDEAFHSTWFEEDYSLRVKSSGFKLLCAGDVFLYHFGGQTFRGNGMHREAVFSSDRNRFMKKWHRRSVAALVVAAEGDDPGEVLEALREVADSAAIISTKTPGAGEFPVKILAPIPGETRGASRNRLLDAVRGESPQWILVLDGNEYPEAALADEIHNLTNPESISLQGWSFPVSWLARPHFAYTGAAVAGQWRPLLFRVTPELAFSPEADARLPVGVDEGKLKRCGVRVQDASLVREPLRAMAVRPWEERGDTRQERGFRQRLLNLLPYEAKRFLIVSDDPEWWAYLLKSWGREEVHTVAFRGITDPIHADSCVHGDPATCELPFDREYFDVIVLDSVLSSHLRPHECLGRCRELVTPEGVILANIYNQGNLDTAASLLLDAWEYRTGSTLDFSHLHLFTLGSLRERIRRAQLHLTFLEGRTAPLRPETKRLAEALRTRLPVSEEEGRVTQFIVGLSRDRERCTFRPDQELPTLSVCLIAKNEEAVLSRCLESVKGIADEIIVVDTGSTDRTVDIATRHGARVHHFAWTKDFSEARNVSLRLATCDWVLVLDADEVLDPGSAMLLKRIVRIGEKPGVLRMYFLRELNYYNADGQAEQVTEHKNLRLFPRDPHILFRGKIHEQVHYDGGLPAERLTTPLVIHHYGYLSAELNRKDRNERNYELILNAIAESPDEPFHKYNMGCQLIFAGEHEKAFAYFDEVTRMIPPGTASGYLPMSFVMAGVCLDIMKQPERGIEYLRKAIDIVPTLADGHYHLGRIYVSLRRDDEAERHLNLAINAHAEFSDYLGNYDMSTTTWKPYMSLGMLKIAQERWGEALEHFFKASTFKPDEEGIWAYIGKCHLAIGNYEKSYEYYTKVHGMNPARRDYYYEWAQACMKTGRSVEAADVLEASFTGGESDDAAMMLIQLELRLERNDAAQQRLDRLIVKSPSHYDAHLARGTLLLKLGRIEEARSDLARAIALSPDAAGAYNNMGALYFKTGDLPRAREQYLLALERAPARAAALHNLVEADLAMDGADRVRDDLPLIAAHLDTGNAEGRTLLKKLTALFAGHPDGKEIVERLTGKAGTPGEEP